MSSTVDITQRKCPWCKKEFSNTGPVTLVTTMVDVESIVTKDNVAGLQATEIDEDFTAIYHQDCYQEQQNVLATLYRDSLLKRLRAYKSYTPAQIQEYVQEFEDAFALDGWIDVTYEELVTDIRTFFVNK